MNRSITIEFEDDQCLTSSELIANLRNIYGNNADIEITPSSKTPKGYIKHGISELITADQAHIFFDEPELYEKKLKTLRKCVIKDILYILNDVIMENEDKFSD